MLALLAALLAAVALPAPPALPIPGVPPCPAADAAVRLCEARSPQATPSRATGAALPVAGCARLAPGDRVVLVVRHGEVGADGTSDPPLSAAGQQRAVALARIAASYDVEAAFSTPFRRTRGTAEPAAEWQGLRVEAVPIPASGIPAHVADLVARVRAAPGPAALVVGHSNTVPAVILALTGIDVGPIGETEFDRLFVVVLPAEGAPTVTERRY